MPFAVERAKKMRIPHLLEQGALSGLLAFFLAFFLLAVPSFASRASIPDRASSSSGCIDGSRRVGTFRSPDLKREWAVIVDCAHPAWPAHLAPATAWPALPAWIPAGSKLRVYEVGSRVLINLEAVTLMPGRVGQKVKARLRDGARVEVRLVGREEAQFVPDEHWR